MIPWAAIVLAAKTSAAPAPPPCVLPWTPSVQNVRVRVLGDEAEITHELLLLPAGGAPLPADAKEVVVHAAFGAPGLPRTVEASITTLRDGELSVSPRSRVDAVPVRQVVDGRGLCALFGRERSQGIAVTLPATRQHEMTLLRLQQRVVLGGRPGFVRDLVVRLAHLKDTAVPLGAVTVETAEGPVSARASLCLGPMVHTLKGAAPEDLADVVLRDPATGSRRAALLAPRRSDESLCLELPAPPPPP